MRPHALLALGIGIGLALVGCADGTRTASPRSILEMRSPAGSHRKFAMETHDDGALHAPPNAVPEDRTVQLHAPGWACSGALIAPDIVLTARHCVVSEEGARVAAVNVRVSFGSVDAPWGTIAAKALAEGDCGSDVALVFLDHRVVGLAPFSVRSARAPEETERFEAIGFGRCDDGDGLAPRRTVFRDVRARIDPHALVARVASCPGDSGGPIVATATDEIVGVLSAGWASRHWPAGVVVRTFGERVDDLPLMFGHADDAAARLVGARFGTASGELRGAGGVAAALAEDASCEERRAPRVTTGLAPDALRSCFDGWCEETVD